MIIGFLNRENVGVDTNVTDLQPQTTCFYQYFYFPVMAAVESCNTVICNIFERLFPSLLDSLTMKTWI